MSSFVQNKIATRVDIRALEKLALELYIECPRFPTIVTHADRTDDSLLHCVPAKPFVGPRHPEFFYRRDFIVPRQEIILVQDEQYGLFTLLKVLETQKGSAFWLFSSVASRMGFIIDYNDLPPSLLVEEEGEDIAV